MSATDIFHTWYIITRSADDTAALAAFVARHAAAGSCVLLHGDLGAGKTQFARGFIRALCGAEEEVASPTFTLVQTYTTTGGVPLAHYDLYRLKDASEMLEIGLEEALDTGITLIEWPQLAAPLLPQDALKVHIAHGKAEGVREITLSASAMRWQPLFEQTKGYPHVA